jgi:Na+/H+-translocating membrane pyrophosphatase
VDFSKLIFAVPAAGALALLYAMVKSSWINRQDAGTDRMKEIGGYIREGAMAFLAREYKVLAIFVVAVAVALYFANRGPILYCGRYLQRARRFYRHARRDGGQRAHHKCCTYRIE